MKRTALSLTAALAAFGSAHAATQGILDYRVDVPGLAPVEGVCAYQQTGSDDNGGADVFQLNFICDRQDAITNATAELTNFGGDISFDLRGEGQSSDVSVVIENRATALPGTGFTVDRVLDAVEALEFVASGFGNDVNGLLTFDINAPGDLQPVSEVPLPAGALLFGSAGAWFMARRRGVR